jgi:glucose/arabinose dehydrogenase
MRAIPFLAVLVMGACSGGSTDTPGTPTDTVQVGALTLRLQPVASGLSNPVHLSAPAGDSRLFIVEQVGRIRIVQNGQLLPTPFLDISSKVRSGGEQGLLSVAFHPQYATNGFFFVNYTDRTTSPGDARVERYSVTSDPNRADPNSAKLIIAIPDEASNHNGGQVLFGPDGMLYIPMGDGGGAGDQPNNAQNRGNLLGDLLRIDVNSGDPYAIPSNNPFRGQAGIRGEIWAYGLRNPWRIAFDRVAGMLYIADVGQNQIEEINVVPANVGGQNYGWRMMEGLSCFNPSSCSQSGLTLPVSQYTHGDGSSVTGGIVYRGSAIPEILGHYFYADYTRGWVRSFRYNNGQVTQAREWNLGSLGNISSFGEDAQGEMYIVSHGGTVSKVVK